MAFGLHPLILIAVIGGLLSLIALSAAFLTRSGRVKAVTCILAFIFILPAGYVFLGFYPELIDARFRTYKAFYRDINVGMTRAEVFALIDRHYPKSSSRQRPKILNDDSQGLGFFMNPEGSLEPNCEGIFLSLDAGGRVTEKKYSPD
jgi:hypothetical protein